MKKLLSLGLTLLLCTGCSSNKAPSVEESAEMFNRILCNGHMLDRPFNTSAFILNSDYGEIFKDGLYPATFLRDIAPRVGEISLDNYSEFMTEREADEIIGNTDYYQGEAYKITDVQRYMDNLFGKGRIDVMRWNSEGIRSVFKGYVILSGGYGSFIGYCCYKLVESRTDKNVVVISAIGIGIDSDLGGITDLSAELNNDYEERKVIIEADISYDFVETCKSEWTVDNILSKIPGGTEAIDQFELIDFVFYNTPEGVRLWGAFPHDQITYPE